MSEVAVLGIDLGKTSCGVVGMSAGGQVVVRRRVARDGIAALLGKLPRCVVAMEACCGAHHVGRAAAALDVSSAWTLGPARAWRPMCAAIGSASAADRPTQPANSPRGRSSPSRA